MDKRQIHIAIIRYPRVFVEDRFGYHINNKKERTIEDLDYTIRDKETLIRKLIGLKEKYSGEQTVVNGIPTHLSDGFAPGFVFSEFPEDDFRDIRSLFQN